MKKCVGCLKSIRDDLEVCPFCGYINPVCSSDSVSNNIQTRDDVLAELQNMIDYFAPLQSLYDEYDWCKKTIDYYKDRRTKIQVSYNNIGVGFCVAGIFFLLMALAGFTQPIYAVRVLTNNKSNSADVVAVVIMVIYLVVILAGIGMILFGVWNSRRYHKACEDQRIGIIRQYENRMKEIKDELNDYCRRYGPCALSLSYSNPRVLEALRSIVLSNRASTFNEAIVIMQRDCDEG